MNDFLTDLAKLNPIAPTTANAPGYNQYNPNPLFADANIQSRKHVAPKVDHNSEGAVGCMDYCRADEEAVYCQMRACEACEWCSDGARCSVCGTAFIQPTDTHTSHTPHAKPSLVPRTLSFTRAHESVSFCEPPSHHTHD